MTDINDLPRVTCDHDWLDLRVGAKAILTGRMTAKKGVTYVLVGLPDWTDLMVNLTDPDGMQPHNIQRSEVSMIIERTEDGIQTSIGDITYTG